MQPTTVSKKENSLIRGIALLILLGSITPGIVFASNTQPSSVSSTPRNMIVFYDDYPTRLDPEFQVTRTIVRPLVAHLDENGKPTDWMFDSFIFFSWWLYVNNNPDQKYIDSWIKYIFDGKQIENLDATVAETKEALGRSDYKMNVFLAIPVPYNAIKAPSIIKNMDKLLSRWNVLKPANLRLVGFFWGFTESLLLPEVEAVIPVIGNYVHSKGLKLLMIPYLNAKGVDKMHALGIDIVTVQPNYAWNPNNDTSTFETVNIEIASGYADGFEYEAPIDNDGSLKCCNLDWRVNLRIYSDQALKYQWNTKVATYYYGTAVSQMGRRAGSDYRSSYETIYQYILSTKAAFSQANSSLSLGMSTGKPEAVNTASAPIRATFSAISSESDLTSGCEAFL